MSTSQEIPVLGDLTSLEEAIVDAARDGTVAEPDVIVELAELAVTDTGELRVRAAVMRELLMGLRGDLDPRGLRIHNVRVVGLLDLDHVTAITGLTLSGCALPDGVNCRRARLREVSMRGSSLSTLNANGLRTDGDLTLTSIAVRGSSSEGGLVQLEGAQIGGRLDLERAEIVNATGPALVADGIRAEDDVILLDAVMSGSGNRGAVRLRAAHLGGQLDLERIKVTNDNGSAITLARVRTGDNLYLRDAVVDDA